MGWEDSLLHAFRCSVIVDGPQDLDFDASMRNEAQVTLAQIAPSMKDRFFFDYDFGDGWEHTVVVESIDAGSHAEAPRCTAGARACPPEDCSGVPGYIQLVRTLNDPAHDDYAAARRWAGPISSRSLRYRNRERAFTKAAHPQTPRALESESINSPDKRRHLCKPWASRPR